MLPLQWQQVDFPAGKARLDSGTTKNGEGRVFPMTADLRRLLQSQQVDPNGVVHLLYEKRLVAYPPQVVDTGIWLMSI